MTFAGGVAVTAVKSEKVTRRRPATLEQLEDKFDIKNTFIDGRRSCSPSLAAFYQERQVRSCPSLHIGVFKACLEALSESTKTPEQTPRASAGATVSTPSGDAGVCGPAEAVETCAWPTTPEHAHGHQAMPVDQHAPQFHDFHHGHFSHGEPGQGHGLHHHHHQAYHGMGYSYGTNMGPQDYVMEPSAYRFADAHWAPAASSAGWFSDTNGNAYHHMPNSQHVHQQHRQLCGTAPARGSSGYAAALRNEGRRLMAATVRGAAGAAPPLLATQVAPQSHSATACPAPSACARSPAVPAKPPAAVEEAPAPPATRSAPPPPVVPAPGSEDMPSVGSVGHASGRCKPCAFVHTKGCASGPGCRFCHLCGPDEKKNRRKQKMAARQANREARRAGGHSRR